MCSRCTSTPLPAHTPVRHRRHTDERSDCKAIPFLTSHVHGHVLHSNGWLVMSPRPPPYAASACPPARSQSHVMFHHSARVDEATISKSPRPSGSACYSATIYRIVTYAHKHKPQCIECHLRIVLHNKGESLRSVAVLHELLPAPTGSRVQLSLKLGKEVSDICLLQHRADEVLTQTRHHDWGEAPYAKLAPRIPALRQGRRAIG